MNKAKSDPKVKKTLVRNYEQKVKPGGRCEVIRDVESDRIEDIGSGSSLKKTGLSEPSLCSSAALANYLSDVKKSLPPPLSVDDLNVERGELCSKMTKKLNFHFNDRIYKNLVELNATIEELKTKKDKKSASGAHVIKKDLEPNIEDFCEDEIEPDFPPKIPVIKSKFRPVKTVEDGRLHKLIASFEVL
ncbi:uncharacterized protein LOC126373884 [Pectinophora gossypiella]|nr:uncharacterized protein LOC126373884 [Pectinophora gossypiella]